MKKIFLGLLSFSLLVTGAVSVSWAESCSVMSIVSVASVETIDSGAQVWLRNETSEACGSIPAGGQKLFNLPPNTSDKAMALILTAISLDKNLWVAFDDSTDPGMIQVFSMQK